VVRLKPDRPHWRLHHCSGSGECLVCVHPDLPIGRLVFGSFHVKSTQKNDSPSGFSSNLVRIRHLGSNFATPNFILIR